MEVKTCSKCKEEKLLSDFPKTSKSWCKKCRATKANEKYHQLTLKQKRARNTSEGYKRSRKKYRSNPSNRLKENEQTKTWYKLHKNYKNTYGRLKKYNLTIADYNKMKQDQNYRCASCFDVPIPGKSKDGFHVDHNHLTGKVRGLLCQDCNLGLGYFHDSAIKCQLAIEYLNRTTNEL